MSDILNQRVPHPMDRPGSISTVIPRRNSDSLQNAIDRTPQELVADRIVYTARNLREAEETLERANKQLSVARDEYADARVALGETFPAEPGCHDHSKVMTDPHARPFSARAGSGG